jgi:hypothetical protein
VEVGAQLSPLYTAATVWPTVSAPGDYDDGEFGRIKISGKPSRVSRSTGCGDVWQCSVTASLSCSACEMVSVHAVPRPSVELRLDVDEDNGRL